MPCLSGEELRAWLLARGGVGRCGPDLPERLFRRFPEARAHLAADPGLTPAIAWGVDDAAPGAIVGASRRAGVVATLGPGPEEGVRALFTKRQPSLALAVDAFANQLLFRLSERALAILKREAAAQGLSLGGPLEPGGGEIGFEHQAGLLALAGAERIGVALSSGGVMTPTKSVSLLLGFGPGLKRRLRVETCGRCPSRETCRPSLAAR
jgi:hypothetical protein